MAKAIERFFLLVGAHFFSFFLLLSFLFPKSKIDLHDGTHGGMVGSSILVLVPCVQEATTAEAGYLSDKWWGQEQ